ncbi:MAG: nitroreductase family protein [Treponema sp.]|nr:nitroreductase family protein [Treponema sp.]
METTEAIFKRKSVRNFLEKDIDRAIIEKILEAGGRAPSPRNIQPWKYIVMEGKEKSAMIEVVREGIKKRKADSALIKSYRTVVLLAEYSLEVLEEAPVCIFVLNTQNKFSLSQGMEEKIYEMMNLQAIGAAIQNMCLAAFDNGIGSLWICDIHIAYSEICDWLKTELALVAVIAFGYSSENPEPRERKPLGEIAEWR